MLQEQPRLCTISTSLGFEVSVLEDPKRELTDIHKANPDGLYERPTIGINGQWPLPIMTATINDTVVVNVINQLGNTIFSFETFSTKRTCLGNQSTTLHFHGIYQNGTTEMDGAGQVGQCGIPPGSQFTYNFTASQMLGADIVATTNADI
jgi:FtsP/CotA-like multicopper oxidase with cupredoxin domain